MAKKIINGRMYNTDTTEVLGSWDNGYPRGDFSFEEQTLHKKKTGEYFVYAYGGAQSNFGDCYGGHDCSGEKFYPDVCGTGSAMVGRISNCRKVC